MSAEKWSRLWVESSFEPSIESSINENRNEIKVKSKKRSFSDSKNSELNDINCDSINTKTTINCDRNSLNSETNCLIDMYLPLNSDELALNKQKLNLLRDWFRLNFTQIKSEHNSRYLLLTGPTGSGKTTSVKVLAKEFNVEVVEYKAHNQYIERDAFDETLFQINRHNVLAVNQFEDFKKFVTNTNRYKQCLGLQSSDGVISSSNSGQSEDRFLKLILIEEFPNVFYYRPESLHKELRQLQRRYGSRCVPIVFIISETINGHSDEYKLLPKTVQLELKMKTIKLNAISETSLHKSLSKLCDHQLSKTAIQNIIELSSGDIRSAINNMQLKYMHLFNDKSQNAFTDPQLKRSKKMKAMIESNLDSGGRDPSLTLSHAIGKILYAKRINCETDATHENSLQMPEHLSLYERKPLIENAENIAEKVIVSSDILNAWLHENYLDFVDSIESAEQCINWLSASDYMFSGQDMANQPICDSYQSSIALRGLMFNLSSSNTKLIHSKVDSNKSTSSNQTNNRKFKAFVKPKVLAVNRSVNSLKQQICHSKLQMTHISGIDSFLIDLLPFISQMPNHLRETNAEFRYLFNKVVNYDEDYNRVTETDLCNAFSQSSVTEDMHSKHFQQNINGFKIMDQIIEKQTQINYNNSDDEDNYQIESDSD